MATSLLLLARNRLGLVVAAGVATLAYSTWDLIEHPVGSGWYILVGLTIISGSARLTIPSVPVSTSISDTFTITAALMFGPSAGAVIVALDAAVLSYRLPRPARSPVRLLFNLTAAATALWIPAKAFELLVGGGPVGADEAVHQFLIGLPVFAGLYFVTNTGLVAVAVAYERQESVIRTWREHFLGLWLTYFGGTAVGGALVYLFRVRELSLGALAIAIPLPLVLYYMFKHALGRTQDQITHLGEINRLYLATIEALANAIDAKDQVTHGHIRRVQHFSMRLATKLRIEDPGQLKAIEAASLLHDMGKIAVPEHILNKPGKLSPAEFEIMKTHAPIGADILSAIDFPYPVVPIVRHHHENWDGTGYPDKIAGDQIPIGARILQVVDCFDALTSDRPYRRRMSTSDATAILRQRRGSMYDPRIVDAFIEIQAEGEIGPEFQEEGAASAGDVRFNEPASLKPAPASEDDAEVKRLLAAYDLGRALANARGSADIAMIVQKHLQVQFPVAVVAIYVYDSRTDSVIVRDVVGDELRAFADLRVALGDGISGWVAANRQPMINADPRLDLQERADRIAPPLRSCLAVPIPSGDGEIAGVIAAYAGHTSAFGDSHRWLFEALASRIAPMIRTDPKTAMMV
jgi:putative nucleotidyltransferase with HDIG domain